jgi:hypothetical protein
LNVGARRLDDVVELDEGDAAGPVVEVTVDVVVVVDVAVVVVVVGGVLVVGPVGGSSTWASTRWGIPVATSAAANIPARRRTNLGAAAMNRPFFHPTPSMFGYGPASCGGLLAV